MGYPRRQLVNPRESGIYHCISRCVRGQSLIESPERCRWVVRRLERLTKIFAIDVCDFAVMRNHVHLLLRTHPDLPLAWTDEEVARRWLSRPNAASGDPDELARCAVGNPDRIAEWRERLADLGWFHKLWKEPCARKWNREEEQSGHLWQGRFRSIGCHDEASVLMQAAYILLNPIHCGAEAELCDSPRTSMGRRIAALSEAIAAGRCRQGVDTYRRALLEPALPCDPGAELRGLSDEDWSDRLVKGLRDRAIRESLAEDARLRPVTPTTVSRSDRDESSSSRTQTTGVAPQPAGVLAAMSSPVQSGRSPSVVSPAIQRESKPFRVPWADASRRMRERPQIAIHRHSNPWRDRSTIAMATSCTLSSFMEWTDRKGRMRRPDKPGRIDPSRPSLLDRLTRRGRWSEVVPDRLVAASLGG